MKLSIAQNGHEQQRLGERYAHQTVRKKPEQSHSKEIE